MSVGLGRRGPKAAGAAATERSGDVEALAEGILREARAEAARAVDEARKRALERLEAAKAQAARVAEDADAIASRQVGAIEREAASKLAAELARAELASREAAWRAVVERARELCRVDAAKPEFRGTLVRLTAEAAVGLGGGEARVRLGGAGSGAVDDALPREAERLARAACGIETKLSLGEPIADGNPGVLLESADGRTSYDNRLEARFSRLEGELRARVLDGLFGDREGESGAAGNGRGEA